MKYIVVNSKIKNQIESLKVLQGAYMIKFKDLTDVFWFNSLEQAQEFINVQVRERVYKKDLRKGYFDYINEAGETLRYYIINIKGKLEVIREKNLGSL